ncbi:hypothetical protein ABPG74_015684 [Tetrahymena malaccensis]
MSQLIQNTEKEFQELTKKMETAYSSQTQDVQKDLLNDLIEIRKALYTDLSNFQGENLDDENKKLREENARLNYRIEILTRSLREVLNNNKVKELEKENEKLQYNINHLRNVVREKVVNN